MIDTNGTVYLCDRENHRIQVFNADGDFVAIWNDIQRPMDITIGTDGIFYVSEGGVDGSSARISLLDGEGKVLARFDCRGSGHGSWVDSHGSIYVGLGLGEPGGVDKYVLVS